MKATKVLLIILAVLLVVGGLYCMFSPALTFAALLPVTGIFMIVDAFGSFVSWNDKRKMGQGDGWMLAGAIISLLVGILVLVNIFARFAMGTVFVYIVDIWMIVVGIIRIVAAFQARKMRQVAPTGSNIGKGWGFMLAMGVLMVLVGIFGFFNPITIALAMGMLIGISITVAGISLFSLSLAL